MASLDQAIAQMIAADMPPLPPGHPIADGRWHRYGPRKKAWYRLFEHLGRNGRRYITGSFGLFRGADPGTFKVQSDFAGMDAGELEQIKRRQAKLEEEEKRKRERRADFAGARGLQQWNAAAETGESPYLKRKGVEPDKGLRFQPDGTLLVPMVRFDVPKDAAADPEYAGPRRLAGLQKIAPDGSKLFNKGMINEGCAARLGSEPKEGEPIGIVEGVATGLSVRQACGRSRTIFVAFNAGGLLPVARILRKLYPKSPFIFFADDDAYLEAYVSKRMRDDYGARELFGQWQSAHRYEAKGGELEVLADRHTDADGVDVLTGLYRFSTPEGEIKSRTFVMQNAGRTKAHAAAREVGNASVVFPEFATRKLHADPDGPKWTDFNDLHAAESLGVVERQVTAAFGAEDDRLEASKQLAGSAKKPREARAGKGGKPPPPTESWEKFWGLVDRFTWIYPTETAYDHQLGDIVGINPMRLQFGHELVQMWLHSHKRRNVDLPDVVFDPTGRARPPKLNLYRGLAIAPSKNGSCAKLINLLNYLCGEDSNVFEWVLKWLAYPLQHPGAKMETALVFRGKEGAGKNLFFETVRSIYGTHGGVITQRELEDRFNLWLSAKLFLIANEVVTRQEMGHQVGVLKHLVTGKEIWINRKMKDARCEENHVNLVFFSNEIQPLQLSADDRRYVVIDTPPKQEKRYYREILDEIAAGGAAALHQYLLEVDLEDFDESAEPIETQAKHNLIEVGMSGPQLFWKDIHDQEIGLPYCPARNEDVYRCFLVWCRRNGEKMPAKINRFIPSFMALNGVRRTRTRIPVIIFRGGDAVQVGENTAQRRVLLMGDHPESVSFEDWIRKGVLAFAEAAEKYCRGEVDEWKSTQ